MNLGMQIVLMENKELSRLVMWWHLHTSCKSLFPVKVPIGEVSLILREDVSRELSGAILKSLQTKKKL